MTSIERIHVSWNASDGYDRFMASGIDAKLYNPPTPEQIKAVLAKEKGRLFRLLGYTDEPRTELVLKINDCSEAGLHLSSEQPPFDAVMTVADEPPPHVTMHGDYLFDLVTVE